MNRHLYRYVEDILRCYPQDCARLKILRDYLSAPVGSDECTSGGEAIPEQERVLFRQEQNREFRALEAVVKGVGKCMDALSDEDYLLVNLRYFRELSWDAVGDEMRLAAHTCRTRRAPRIISKIARILIGEIVDACA